MKRLFNPLLISATAYDQPESVNHVVDLVAESFE